MLLFQPFVYSVKKWYKYYYYYFHYLNNLIEYQSNFISIEECVFFVYFANKWWIKLKTCLKLCLFLSFALCSSVEIQREPVHSQQFFFLCLINVLWCSTQNTIRMTFKLPRQWRRPSWLASSFSNCGGKVESKSRGSCNGALLMPLYTTR